MSLLSKIVPKGIRKLTWKKVGHAAKVVVPLAAAVAIPGVGGLLVKGVTAAGSVAGKLASRTAATVGNVAKAASKTAGDLADDISSVRQSVDDARDSLRESAEGVDRAIYGPLPSQSFGAFVQQNGTLLMVGVVGLVLLVVVMRRK